MGSYAKFSQAQERGLVAAALDIPYWVLREGPRFVLYVEPREAPRMIEELRRFEAEDAQRGEEAVREIVPSGKVESWPLFVAAWTMAGGWALQNFAGQAWTERGTSLNTAIFSGEWWRVFTALLLHGDVAHFAANVGFGLLFGAFLLPRFGPGLSALGVLLAGGLGNLANAYFYRAEPHASIGASTAVFGALGLLVAWELAARIAHPRQRGWWSLLVPIGGGFALLALLGVGDEAGVRVDYMAHFWGFIAGFVLGIAAAGSGWMRRATVPMQWAGGTAAAVLLCASWWLAMRQG